MQPYAYLRRNFSGLMPRYIRSELQSYCLNIEVHNPSSGNALSWTKPKQKVKQSKCSHSTEFFVRKMISKRVEVEEKEEEDVGGVP